MITGKFPNLRLRRTRKYPWSRRLVQENNLSSSDFIFPIFLIEGKNKKQLIKSMPSVYRYTIDKLGGVVENVLKNKIPMVALFPSTPESKKDNLGSEALNEDNLVCKATRYIKKRFKNNVGVMCDVALDPYTSHGHDGVFMNGDVDNDKTIKILAKQSLLQAQMGCDIIAPSDMMDGRVKAIRDTLESNKFFDTIILSYAAKYASSFYGPFREAVGSAPNLGKASKKTYQMNFANLDEALHEVGMDIEEGADIVMVKPGTAYLDVVHAIKSAFQVPTFVYQVSGEYSMLQLSIEKGWLDKNVMLESLMCCKRAGADAILTYAAKQIASELNS